MTENKEQQVNIEIPEEIAEGKYANLVMVAHSKNEFVIDFIGIMPGVNKTRVSSRIILSPENTLKMLAALNDNIQKYEKSFGEINHGGRENTPPYFGGSMGEA